MTVELFTYNAPGGRRTISFEDLPEAYADASAADAPVFSRGNLLQVWIIDAERCHVQLRDGGRWFDLAESDAAGETAIRQANIPGTVPAAAVLPRSRGLDVLTAADVPALCWRPVPDWVVDRGGYLLRDVVEAMWDRAGDLHLDGAPETAPRGLRHLSYLVGFHAGVMGDGLDWVLDVHTPEQLGAAAEAAAYLGLNSLAELIGRLAASGRDFELAHTLTPAYYALTGPPDAEAIRAAVRRRVAEDPAGWSVGPLT
ncbi:hypothetical protein GCM10010112_19930 [Actinoplanes lobatus]|uniref:Uncharacterized protein n=1 Tax=Actinoplanes lobatus TaxID=113568 RepID=A0A7W7HPG6_9ACTN|nr:hypothetical protein [Actinoplanes lobatus]MBB4754250.1 hypothetical protein [Actinoplanes lobatus]GGN62108.1 hypothetical protein GCM10010112_19930 [Actinoplanes lobatus]GIE44873.1 hypothetical protein Alo02nite_77710 [Actinoplanes lobatus]